MNDKPKNDVGRANPVPCIQSLYLLEMLLEFCILFKIADSFVTLLQRYTSKLVFCLDQSEGKQRDGIWLNYINIMVCRLVFGKRHKSFKNFGAKK